MHIKLQSKMLIAILVPLCIAFTVLTCVTGYFVYKQRVESTTAQYEQILEAKAFSISENITRMQSFVRTVSTLSRVRDVLSLSDLGTQPEELLVAQNIIETYLRRIPKQFPSVEHIGLVDTMGNIVADTDAKFLGNNIMNFHSVSEALAGNEKIEIREDTKNHIAYLLYSFPVVHNDKVIGALLLTQNLQTLSALFDANPPKLKPNTFYVYNDKLHTIIANVPEKIASDDSNLPHIGQLVTKKTGSLNYSHDDKDFTLYFCPIKALKWIMVLEVEKTSFIKDIAVKDSIAQFIAILAGVALLCLLFVALFAVMSIMRVSRDLRKTTLIAKHVAKGEQSFTAAQNKDFEMIAHRNDDIALLAGFVKTEIKHLNLMYKKGLHDAAVRLENTIINVHTSAKNLASHISNSSASIDDQTGRITETATAVDEMTATVLEIAKNSSASAGIAENTRQEAIGGSAVTMQCKSAMNHVLEESLSLRNNMGTLAQHANSINTIMGVISDIADQTNLLALNAAIEAARAGDAGRGFAVVADEVRKLAEKTIASTSNVANTIVAIQESTESNVQQVDSTVQSIEEATALTIQSEESLQVILEMAELSADSIRAIATASEEQSVTSDEINRSVLYINGISSDTASAVLEASHSISELANQASNLSRIIKELKHESQEESHAG